MDDRLTDLEIRIAFLEQELREVSDVLRETRDLLDAATAELTQLRDHVVPNEPFDAKAEVPPHY
ncbi:MAG: SlyX family protein [Deltaproteobacteria bacterium]|nr:SlyX family protein [Deltaproteobacteria bacterium]